MGSLPDMARAEALIRSGQRDAGLSVAEDVAKATEVLARLRGEGTSVGDYVKQVAMGERELTPFQEQVLGFLDQNQRRPSAIRQALRDYADVVENAADPNQVDMFGDAVAGVTKEDAWASATAGVQRERQARVAAQKAKSEAAYAARTPAHELVPATGGPEGVLAQEGAPTPLARPASAERGTLPAGGPEGRLTREGAPPEPANLPPVGDLSTGGPEGALVQQPGAPDDVLRQFRELVRDPEKADRAAVEYQSLVEAGASPEALATFRRNAEDSRWWDRFDTLRYASMLSDPVTHGQNALGNALLGAVDVVERPLTALLDMGRAKITGGPRDAFLSEASAHVLGAAGSARQALSDAAFVIQHGLRPEDAAKLDRPTRGFGTNIPGLAPRGSGRAGAVDFAMEGPLRALSAADAFFRGTAKGGHLAAEATNAAIKANGGRPATAEQVTRMMLDPDVAARASSRAAQSVLQENRQLTTAINAMRAKLPQSAQAIVGTAVPYIKTPYNIVAQGVGMTPAGVYSLVKDIRNGAPMRERERRVSRMMIGSAVMAWAGWENLQGTNTGAYPEKESERSTLPPGWRPYSRKVEVGGETYYVPLALLGPLGIPAAVGIMAAEQSKDGSFTADKAAKVADAMGKFAEDQTFLRSIGDGLAAVSKGGNTLENYIERQASQFSPHLIGGGGIGRRIEAIQGQPTRDPEGLGQAWLATLPYGDELASALGVDSAEVRRDVLGRPSVSNPDGAAALVPIRASRENDAPVIAAFRAGGEGLPTSAPDRLTDPQTRQQYALNPRQQARWQREFGQELTQRWQQAGSTRDPKRLREVEGAARAAVGERLIRDLRGGPAIPAGARR
jgi:hypothetical protein